MTSIWLKLLAAHFIGDFAFQSTWMGSEKGKSWEVLFYHSATYVATFILLGFGLTPLGFALLFMSHFIIDACKARYGYIKSIWADQIWHMIILAIIWLVLGTCNTLICG